MYSNILLEKAIAKILRSIIRSMVSKKRISQLFFEKLVFRIRQVEQTQEIMYLRSDALFSFLCRGVPPHRVIVAGGTDHDITQAEYELMKQYVDTKFYVQNLNFPELDNVLFLPIGVEDMHWGKNGMPWNFRKGFRLQSKQSKILVGPFGLTHSSRQSCLLAGLSTSSAVVVSRRIASWDYSSLSSKYLFIACPRGNGLDTHRFWETLYRGSIPVVLASAHSENLSRYGVPHAAIKEWNALESVLSSSTSNGCSSSHSFLDPEWWQRRFLADIEPHDNSASGNRLANER